MNDGATVLALISRARRRIGAVIFVRSFCVALLTAGVALVLVRFADAVDQATLTLAIVGAAAALSAAAIATAARMPSHSGVAQALDARLGLQDRASAALALREGDDPVSLLVVRDARERLTAVPLAQAFPFPRRLIAWGAGGAFVTLALAALPSSPASIGTAPARDGRIMAGSPASSTQPASAATAPAQTAAAPVETPSSRRSITAGERDHATGRSGGDTSRRLPAQRERAAGLPDAGRAGRPGDGAQTLGTNGRTNSRNPGTGAAGTVAMTPAAGGIAQGSVQARTPGGFIDNGRLEPGAAGPRRAQAAAEAAIARDEIPPRFSSYVRAYFRAIQREERR
jgi:hypothetical protein